MGDLNLLFSALRAFACSPPDTNPTTCWFPPLSDNVNIHLSENLGQSLFGCNMNLSGMYILLLADADHGKGKRNRSLLNNSGRRFKVVSLKSHHLSAMLEAVEYITKEIAFSTLPESVKHL